MDRFTVTLEALQWQLVLDTLAEGPYRRVAPLIAAIAQQCQAAPPGAAPPPQLRSNGEARA